MVTKYIGADVHVATTDLAIERNGKIIGRHHVETKIPALREVLEKVPSPRVLVFEEGPMAGWLYRSLRDHVEQVIVCDPRRNHYIAKDGDKDDRIDAAKLAALARGGYLREVYHSDAEDRVAFKRWTMFYHDRIADRTRHANKIHACARRYGVRVPSKAFTPKNRSCWMDELAAGVLRDQLELLWPGYDLIDRQADEARRQVRRRSGAFPIIKLWQEVPGMGPIRSATLFAYLDTPWRFRRANKLWKYCGLGLQRSASGSDKYGRPKPARVHLAWQVNKRLKDAIVGAAVSAIGGYNVFDARYRSLLHDGILAGNARHTVARRMLTVLWGMWKRQARFDPSWV